MLYLVERTDHADYDEYDEIIVRAASVKEALALVCASDPEGRHGEKYCGYRADGSNAKATPVPAAGPAEVVLTYFHAG